MILNFDDLFCIPPSKELLLVAMEMISIMLKKETAKQITTASHLDVTFKKVFLRKWNNYELYILAIQKPFLIHSPITAEKVIS